MKKINKKILIIIALIVFIIAGIAFLMRDTLESFIAHKPTPSPSLVFSFNTKTALDWWAGDNFDSRATVTNDYQGSTPIEKLPVAGRVINQGGSKDHPANGCFVMYSYYDYAADTVALQKEREEGMTAKSSLTMEHYGTHSMAIDTPEGVKTYQLSQYGISGPGSETMMRGVELGYVNLSNGYITIEGDCQEPNMLDTTIEAIQSIALTKDLNK